MNYGYAILLTNNHLYWNPPGKPDNNDADFMLHEDREITGTLAWGSNTGTGTLKGRENPIEIAGKYTPRWKENSNPPGTGYTRFRYLLLHVKPRDC